MTAAGLLEHDSVDQELLLLIREARQRQRRRQLRRVLAAGMLTLTAAILILLEAMGALSPSANSAGGRPAQQAAAPCRTSSARFVANSTFSATVLGRGAVRLGIGNVYLKRSRRVVLGTTSTPGWYAMEAIWIRQPGHPGTLRLRGARLGKPGPIEVGSSNAGPGTDALPLAPGSANTAPGGLQFYPAVIWVRSGGCYAVTVRGRGVDDRIVFGAQAG